MTAPRTIGIGILGFGTVGQGVWKHLHEKQTDLESRLGVKLDLRKASVRDLKKKRAVKIPASKLTTDVNEIIDDPKVHVVCELIGGTTKARELTLRALRLGKVVVSANKALLCEHGPEIMQAVRQHGGQFLFEASVAGGIPIIKAIREGLVANRFELIVGILNGTCNHILTRMGEDGLSFADALKEAQELGYAEADPTLDVDGIDAFHKASILAWLAHGKWAPSSRTLVEGIRKIGPADIDFARRFGFALKHLAVIRRDFKSNWMTVGVYPSLVPNRDILARVSGVNNGITLRGDVVGATTLTGRGAGGDATASAVIGDIVDAIAALTGAIPQALSPDALAAREKAGRALRMASIDEIVSPFYLRLSLLDKAGVSEGIYRIFSKHKVSIARVIQYEHPNQGRSTVTLSTYPVSERKMSAVLTELRRLKTVLEEPVVLRIFSPNPDLPVALIVQKYGGTSVGNVDRIQNVAAKIKEQWSKGNRIVVVVSARSGVTNDLIARAKALSKLPDEREMDVLMAVGEQETIALTVMALHAIGVPAVSRTGAQAGIFTDDIHTRARITRITGGDLLARLDEGKVVVVAGFQGCTDKGEVTTLGRGGSDLTAIAVAASIKADLCQIYTDVDGVYTADPRIVLNASKLPEISYEEMLELASSGSKVMQSRSVEFAQKYNVPFEVRSSFNDQPGTIVKAIDKTLEDAAIAGVALDRLQTRVTVNDLPDSPQALSALFDDLGEAGLSVDMIIKNLGKDGKANLTFSVTTAEFSRVEAVVGQTLKKLGSGSVRSAGEISKLSIVGVGMISHPGVAGTLFKALASVGINSELITTSEIKISVALEPAKADAAVRAVHTAFGLDKA